MNKPLSQSHDMIASRQLTQVSCPVLHYQQSAQEDEISLIDLARVVVDQKRVFFLTLFVVVCTAMFYLTIRTELYEFVTVVESVKTQDNGETKIGTTDDLEKIRVIYLPMASELWQKEHAIQDIPFTFSASTPKGSELLIFNSKASLQLAEQVSAFHKTVASHVLASQQEGLSRKRAELEQKIATLKQKLNNIEVSNADASMLSVYLSTLNDKENQLLALVDGGVVELAIKQPIKTKLTPAIVMVLSIVMGVFIGLVMVFLVVFIGKVRMSLQEFPSKTT